MTRQSSFKKKIRDRMKTTNERYAVARQALLGTTSPPQTATPNAGALAATIEGYPVFPGVHGDTARLTAALQQWGVVDDSGAPFDEAAVFAMSGGVGFMYFLFEYKDTPPLLTFTCRSWSMPWPLVERVITNAGFRAEVVETTSEKKARTSLDASLDEGRVAHVTVDMASLPWMGAEPIWKGQMPRQLNVLARDGDTYAIDDGAVREIDAATLAAARAACRKQKNRLVTIAPSSPTSPVEVVRATAAAAVRVFTETPVKGFANNFGLAGLQKAQALVGGEKDKKSWARVFDTPALAHRALRRTWECIHLDYTPPAAGRAFFADGLRSLSKNANDTTLTTTFNEAASLADESGAIWEKMADRVLEAGGPSVRRAVEIAEEIDELQRLRNDAAAIAQHREDRDALANDCTLTRSQAHDIFSELSDAFGSIATIEKKMVDTLKRAATSD